MMFSPKPFHTMPPVMSEPPSALLPWLTCQGSLTERLQDKAGNTHLDVLTQYWTPPDSWDTQVLHIEDHAVLHREILMQASYQPCWYARTIIPHATYNVGSAIFDRLENESLGMLIFNESRIQRVSLVHYPIDAQSIEYNWLTETMHEHVNPLWVRLATFTFDTEFPFYLIEIMLPGLMRYSN